MIASEIKDLWGIYYNHQHLDPDALTRAVEDQVRSGDLDYRTRLLIRQSMDALRAYWGDAAYRRWVVASPVGDVLEKIGRERFDDDVGFPSLRERVMDVTKPETIRAFFRDLGVNVPRPLRLHVGGAVACILTGYLSRKTEDVDVVDEVPAEIRKQHQLLDQLKKRYRLELGHFQSHYLPSGWEQRIHSQAPFGQLQIFLVDVYDVFLSKLCSDREKDKDDLQALVSQLDKDILVHKLKTSAQGLVKAEDMKAKAEKNWYILFGEPLPS